MTDKDKIKDVQLDSLTGGLGEDDGTGPADMTTNGGDPSGSGTSAEMAGEPEGGETITPEN